jgi:hypothetical protein
MVIGAERLQALKARPEMWAITKEAFCALVGCALEQAGVAKPHVMATRIAFGHHGAKVDLDDIRSQFTVEWAADVVDRALKLLPVAPRVFTEEEYQADPSKVVAHAAETGIAVVARADGTPRVVIFIPPAEYAKNRTSWPACSVSSTAQ